MRMRSREDMQTEFSTMYLTQSEESVKCDDNIVLGNDVTKFFRRHPERFAFVNDLDHCRTGAIEELEAGENLIKYAAI